MHDVKYGDSDIKSSGIGYAILDTGTSLMYLGKSDYYNFLDKLLSAVPEFDCTSSIYCFSNTYTCDYLTPRMDSITIQLGENYYTMPPEAYTFSATSRFSRKCTVGISYTEDSSGIYILGDTFLRNYVTTFDFKKNEMRLAVNKDAPTGLKVEYKMSGWKIFLIILGCLVAVVLLLWLVCCLCKKY